MNRLITAGAAVTLMFAFGITESFAAPKLTICGASANGNYTWAAKQLKRHLAGQVDVTVATTKGSWQNLELMAEGKCQAGIVQSDAWYVWAKEGNSIDLMRIGVLFPEVAHLICNNDSGIDELADLEGSGKRILIGKNGSGSNVTWKGIVYADKQHGGDDYSDVATLPLGGIIALSKVVDGSEAACMLYVSSTPSSFMKKVDAQASDSVDIMPIVDYDLNDTEDAAGNSVYDSDAEVPDVYNDIGSWRGVNSISVSALFVINADWAEANEDAVEALAGAVLSMKPDIKTRFHQD